MIPGAQAWSAVPREAGLRYTVDMTVSADSSMTSSGVCWDPADWQAHNEAYAALNRLIEDWWTQIPVELTAGRAVSASSVQAALDQALRSTASWSRGVARVAADVHTAVPGYASGPPGDGPIQAGALVRIHLSVHCAQRPRVSVSCMQTAYLGNEAPPTMREAFEVVRRGRDVTADYLREAFADERDVHGWEVDSVCRREMTGLGYGAFVLHRTGYSLGYDERHEAGPALDDGDLTEQRLLRPGMAFAVEPGLYLPERFGVQTGLSLYVDHGGRVHIAAPTPQASIRLIAVQD